jgi:hypothetical protein
MQKLIKLSTLAVAMSLAAAAHADVTVPSLKGGFNVAVEANYLKPYGVDNIYGPVSSIDSEGVNVTTYHHNDAKFKFGYGVTVGYTMPNTANDIEVSYNRYDSKRQEDSFQDADELNGGAAAFQVKLDRVDLLLGQYINVGSNLQLHLKGGLSYAKLSYVDGIATLRTEGIYTDAQATASESKFKGFGPTLGLDSTYTFGQTGFGVVAGLSTSMLVGKLDYTSVDTDVMIDNSSQEVISAHANASQLPSKSQIVPVLGAKLGLTYERSINDAYKLGVEAGYKADSYLKVGQDNEVRQNKSDLTIAGPYLKLKLAAC